MHIYVANKRHTHLRNTDEVTNVHTDTFALSGCYYILVSMLKPNAQTLMEDVFLAWAGWVGRDYSLV